MEQIFKNMDDLKNDLFKAIETICKDYETKPEPEFKAGQWSAFKANDNEIYPFLIHHFEDDKVYGQDFKCKDDIYKIWYQTNRCNLISVTEEEIESHLKKICDEKYIGKKYITAFEKGQIHTFPDNPNYHYDTDRDSFDCGKGYGFLYFQVKFAEIISDKKKLPKTKEGLRELLKQVQDDSLLPFPTIDIDEFID